MENWDHNEPNEKMQNTLVAGWSTSIHRRVTIIMLSYAYIVSFITIHPDKFMPKKKKRGKNDQPEVQVKGMATFNSLIQRELLKPYQHLISL